MFLFQIWLLWKFNYIDVMIFKRVSLYRKKLWLCKFVNKKCLKAIYSAKTKIFERSFWIYILVLVISFLQQHNLIHKVWVDLKNERKHMAQDFLGRISKSACNKSISRVMGAFRKLQVTWIRMNSLTCVALLFRLSIWMWVYCGSNFLFLREFYGKKRLCKFFHWHSMYFSKRVIHRYIQKKITHVIIWKMYGFSPQFSTIREDATKPMIWRKFGKFILILFL